VAKGEAAGRRITHLEVAHEATSGCGRHFRIDEEWRRESKMGRYSSEAFERERFTWIADELEWIECEKGFDS